MSQERILIVDGNVALSEVLKTRLEEMGYLVDCVSSGTEAMDVMQTEWIDLIVLDIVLKGGMNGFQFFKEIRKKKAFSKIPIVMQSGKSAMRKTFEVMGAAAFFIKPYSIELFLGEIKDILTRKILVLGDDKKITDEIIQNLGEYDFQVNYANTVDKFYINITLFRYDLIIIPHKIRVTMAERLIAVVRWNSKNRNTPVVVYSHRLMASGEAEGLDVLKERCERFGACDFIEKEYSVKTFMSMARKYI